MQLSDFISVLLHCMSGLCIHVCKIKIKHFISFNCLTHFSILFLSQTTIKYSVHVTLPNNNDSWSAFDGASNGYGFQVVMQLYKGGREMERKEEGQKV